MTTATGWSTISIYYSQQPRRLERACRRGRALHQSAGTRAAIRTRSSRPGFYLAVNPDVKAAGVNPLDALRQTGWNEGRVPSLTFDPAAYLAANPDVAAAHVDPLRAFPAVRRRRRARADRADRADRAERLRLCLLPAEQSRRRGGRRRSVPAFREHRLEGRAQSERAVRHAAAISTNYTDVAAAGVNPLDHYNMFGWHEGRDPSLDFDTTSYLAANPDVKAAAHQSAGALPRLRHPRGTLAVRRRGVDH